MTYSVDIEPQPAAGISTYHSQVPKMTRVKLRDVRVRR